MLPPLQLSCLVHAVIGALVMVTTTPVAAQEAIAGTRPCNCGPSALPAYVPPYPNHAARPTNHVPQGVAYRDGSGFKAARTDLGASAYEAQSAPALWSGLYIGLHGGYAFGRTTIPAARMGDDDTKSGFAGVHIGQNWHAGSFVLGLEADVSRNLASGGRSSASHDWTASGRLRAGITFGPLLAFATAGAAVAGNATSATIGGSTWAVPDTHWGIVYGGGLEWQVTRSISLRGEVLRYEFKDRLMHVGRTQSPLTLDETVVRGSLSFRFN